MELGDECKLLLENVAHAVERTRRAVCLLKSLFILTRRKIAMEVKVFEGLGRCCSELWSPSVEEDGGGC